MNKKTISLSSAITTFLEEIDLLDSVDAVSTFHPLEKKYKGKILAGGVYLAKSELEKYKEHLIFFDSSQDLSKTFKKLEAKSIYEITTRGLSPITVIENTAKLLMSKTTSCDDKIAAVVTKYKNLAKDLLKSKPLRANFFVGDCKNKLTQILIVHDGFVEFLIKNKIVKTYDSELAFVSWSQKILNQMKDYQNICIDDAKVNTPKFQKLKTHWQIHDSRALSPGISQLKFLKDFIQDIQK